MVEEGLADVFDPLRESGTEEESLFGVWKASEDDFQVLFESRVSLNQCGSWDTAE
jgi:hypothetical protein